MCLGGTDVVPLRVKGNGDIVRRVIVKDEIGVGQLDIDRRVMPDRFLLDPGTGAGTRPRAPLPALAW